MSAKTAYKPTPAETAAHITTAQALEATIKTALAGAAKAVMRPADPYIGGESFDYST